MVTPDDIRQARFKVAPRGYAIPEVDDFLDGLIRKASQSGDESRRVRALQAQLRELQRENAELRRQLSAQQPTAEHKQETSPSVLEMAFERMSKMTESSTAPENPQAHERPRDYDWSSSAIFSSLESSLFDNDRR